MTAEKALRVGAAVPRIAEEEIVGSELSYKISDGAPFAHPVSYLF